MTGVVDRMGMLEWTAASERGAIHDGVDTYLIEGGRIRVQTIHYSITSVELSMTQLATAGGDAEVAARSRS
jgi:hypothetical protein